MAEWCQTVSGIRALVRFLETLSDPRHPKQAKHRSVGLLVAVAVAVVMGDVAASGAGVAPLLVLLRRVGSPPGVGGLLLRACNRLL